MKSQRQPLLKPPGHRTLLNFHDYPDQPSCVRWDIPVKRSAMASRS